MRYSRAASKRSSCASTNASCRSPFCGVPYDREFIARLSRGVDACGENGEFHTCVVAAPLFRRRLDGAVAAVECYEAPAAHGGDRFWFARMERNP